jgi:hypothetical protein
MKSKYSETCKVTVYYVFVYVPVAKGSLLQS